MRLDEWIDDRAARLSDEGILDRVMYAASWFGDDGKGWIAASLVQSARRPRPVHRFARHLIWLGIESAVVNGPAKGIVRRPRPAARARVHPVRRPNNSSFPSGHAASAATMAMLLSEDGFAPLWWTVAFVVAGSRVYVGVHHASDVAAGLAVGTAIGWAARHIDLPIVDQPSSPDPAH